MRVFRMSRGELRRGHGARQSCEGGCEETRAKILEGGGRTVKELEQRQPRGGVERDERRFKIESLARDGRKLCLQRIAREER